MTSLAQQIGQTPSSFVPGVVRMSPAQSVKRAGRPFPMTEPVRPARALRPQRQLSKRASSSLKGYFCQTRAGFTLFEVLVALAVFALAAMGLVQAISGTIDAALVARDRVHIRTLLESRLAICLVAPPAPENQRVTEPEGYRITESLVALELQNVDGEVLPSMYRLTIKAESTEREEENETITVDLYHPEPFEELVPP